jgi:hypothetical protein
LYSCRAQCCANLLGAATSINEKFLSAIRIGGFYMKHNQRIKLDIQNDIRDLAKIIGLLSIKYKEEPLLIDAQKSFLDLSVHVGRALNIQLQ